MLVSILIPNYNYGRYLSAAIDSALSQTYRDIEVIVVDDGSTDDSPGVIAAYGERVISVRKQNGGLASALNAGFERSHGDLVCPLDADDVFEPDKVERVVAAARRAPDAYLIHHQMQIIDEVGNPTDPPFPRYLAHGDLRSRVIRAGGWFPHPLASGLSFRRSYAGRLFPIPEELLVKVGSEARRIRMFPDTYLAGPAAILAPVAAIRAPLTLKRTHDENMTFSVQANLSDQLFRYRAEVTTLAAVMREVFGQSLDLRMEGHLEYQILRYTMGQISRAQAAARVARTPSIPVAVRVREAVRVGTKRGMAVSAER